MSSVPIEISGTWQMVRAEFDGENAPDEVVQRTEIEFTATRYIVRFAGKATDRGNVEFPEASTATQPESSRVGVATLALHGMSGVNAGRIIPCLYQRVGDRLRVCFGIGGTLPTEFNTRAGQQRYLATYRLI